MRAVQEEECRELQQAIEYRHDRHKRLTSMMERKQKLMGEILEFREKLCQRVRVLDDKISAEEWDLLEKKQAMEELLKKGEVPKWRRGDTVVAEGGVTQKAAAGSRSLRV